MAVKTGASAGNVTVPAVVLAGGRPDASLIAREGVDNRALINLAQGKSMVSLVAGALVASRAVSHVVVVGNVPSSAEYVVVTDQGSLIANILAGVSELSIADPAQRVLIASSDIPFVTPEAVECFVEESLALGAAFCYPIVSMTDYNRQYPMLRRTTLKLREGEFTGGNVVLMSAGFLKDREALIRSVYDARKNVAALARMLGPNLLLRLALTRLLGLSMLNIPMLEQAVGRLLGNEKVAAVVTRHACLGADIDRPEEIEVARRLLSSD